MLGIFKLLTLPINSHFALVIVVSEYGSPRDAVALEKFNKLKKILTVIVKFAVNQVSGNNYKVGICIFYDFTKIIVAAFIFFVCRPISFTYVAYSVFGTAL